MDLDFTYMTTEELDELIAQIKGGKPKDCDFWNNVRRSVQNYVMECGMIELFIEDYNSTLDADSRRD